MASYTSLDTFLPEILQYVQGCPTIMARTHIRNAVILFCERTRILKRNPSTFCLTEDEHTYTMKYSGDRYVAISAKECNLGDGENGQVITETTEHELDHTIRNWRVRESNEPTSYFLTDDVNQVRFYPMPDQDSDDEIIITTIVKPRRNVTEVDEFLWEKWEETIQAGALASLLSLPGATWYDQRTANLKALEFRRGVRRARATTVNGTSEKPNSVTPVSYENVGGDQYNRRTITWE